MAYSTVDDARAITGLSSNDVSDAVLYSLGTIAAYKLNRDINTEVIREPIEYIDGTRENNIDGSNTTYYVRNWKDYIADKDGDQDVDTSDINVYQVESDGTETELTVSSITANDGKFILSSAPSSDVNLYVSYEYAPVSVSDPHKLISAAHSYLVASMSMTRLSVGQYNRVRIGAISVSLNSLAQKVYLEKYDDVINQINNRMTDYVEADVF